MSDFVGELLDSREYAELASKIYRLADGLRGKITDTPIKPSATNTALIFFFARSFKTFQAAIELLRIGFWQDTAVLARVLREAEYQVAWIIKNGDGAAELFLTDYKRNKRNVIRNIAKHGDSTVKDQAQAVAGGFPPDPVLDEWWQNWWSKDRSEGISWLARKLDRNAHRFEYATLSAFVHTSPALLDYYFHESAQGNGATIETRPGVSKKNRPIAELVIFSVFAAFTDLCANFAKCLELGFENELKDITEQIRQQFGSAT